MKKGGKALLTAPSCGQRKTRWRQAGIYIQKQPWLMRECTWLKKTLYLSTDMEMQTASSGEHFQSQEK